MMMNLEGITLGYTIHNKKDLIPLLIYGLKENTNSNDEVLFVFDNCTDGSQSELLSVWHELMPDRHFRALNTDEDLYEVKANNLILRNASKDVIVLFQDDMVLKDLEIEIKIRTILDRVPDVGLMGARSGFELRSTSFPERPENRVSNWEHREEQMGEPLFSTYQERTFLNRGPIVFTKNLLNKVGYLNEDYYPQWGDDLDYCARCKFKYNLRNLVIPIDIECKEEWGTMRQKPNRFIQRSIKPNWNRFIKDWGKYLK